MQNTQNKSKITIATVNTNAIEGYAVFVRNVDENELSPRINKWTLSFDKALEFANFYAETFPTLNGVDVIVYVTEYIRPMHKIDFSVAYSEDMGA